MANTQVKSGWLRASVVVQAPIDLIWEYWTKPEHITQWNSPSSEWVTRSAVNDCRPGGRFIFEMGLADGSLNFDYTGGYLTVAPMQTITHVLDDNRNTIIRFMEDSGVTIIEDFEADPAQDAGMQQQFRQSVLEHFRIYAEEESGKPA